MSKILIVEDDEPTALWLSGLLSSAGHEVKFAECGECAEKLLEWMPDLILLDLMMPQENGWQFLDRKNSTPYARVPVVVLSAWANIEQPTPGVVAIIQKPTREEVVLETVELALGGSP